MRKKETSIKVSIRKMIKYHPSLRQPYQIYRDMGGKASFRKWLQDSHRYEVSNWIWN